MFISLNVRFKNYILYKVTMSFSLDLFVIPTLIVSSKITDSSVHLLFSTDNAAIVTVPARKIIW
jgi:hypothetical protein